MGKPNEKIYGKLADALFSHALKGQVHGSAHAH